MSRKKKIINNSGIPQEAIDRLARAFYPAIRAYYETEEGRKKLEEYYRKAEQKEAEKKGGDA